MPSGAADDAPSPLPLNLPASSADAPDFWEGEQFETLGTAARAALAAVAVFALIAAGYASSSYNDGAVGVDFQAAASPQEAVANALAAAGMAPPAAAK